MLEFTTLESYFESCFQYYKQLIFMSNSFSSKKKNEGRIFYFQEQGIRFCEQAKSVKATHPVRLLRMTALDAERTFYVSNLCSCTDHSLEYAKHSTIQFCAKYFIDVFKCDPQ